METSQFGYHIPLFLAQDGATGSIPIQGTNSSSTNGTLGAPGVPGTADQSGGALPPRASGGDGGQIILMMLIGLVLAVIVMSFFGSRRDRKKREEMLSAIKKHDKVQTIGGVIGTVVEIKSNIVVLKVDESANTRITFARSAIQQVVAESDEKKEKEAEATDA